MTKTRVEVIAELEMDFSTKSKCVEYIMLEMMLLIRSQEKALGAAHDWIINKAKHTSDCQARLFSSHLNCTCGLIDIMAATSPDKPLEE